MENTCSELLEICLRGGEWSEDLLARAIAENGGRTFLSTVIERLGDLFEPRLCRVYERLFAQAIEGMAQELAPRIRRSKTEATPPRTAGRVYVLSRVTLGADVAISSVLLDAARTVYPRADIVFVGPRKSYELFEADPRVRHLAAPYARGGTLRERLEASASLWLDDGIVIDSDSRLTQLGLISVCDPSRYFHFPSREYGGDGLERLPELAARWAREVFGAEDARPYVAPLGSGEPSADITVSLGVGENLAKRMDDAFERDLLRALAETGGSILVDKGGSGEERARVERALLPGTRTHLGEFAPFAAQIGSSRLFVGYDSAGGHVASACGVPLISIANGFVSERAAARWRPIGAVIRGDEPEALAQVRAALTSFAQV